mmetsp:Transcript_29778/g.96058  ORF Transcript_29778/g.96058 Transcript_29778/m.96058 type:complete len:402 (-) Transcript_29778:769-1974(-)
MDDEKTCTCSVLVILAQGREGGEAQEDGVVEQLGRGDRGPVVPMDFFFVGGEGDGPEGDGEGNGDERGGEYGRRRDEAVGLVLLWGQGAPQGLLRDEEGLGLGRGGGGGDGRRRRGIVGERKVLRDVFVYAAVYRGHVVSEAVLDGAGRLEGLGRIVAAGIRRVEAVGEKEVVLRFVSRQGEGRPGVAAPDRRIARPAEGRVDRRVRVSSLEERRLAGTTEDSEAEASAGDDRARGGEDDGVDALALGGEDARQVEGPLVDAGPVLEGMLEGALVAGLLSPVDFVLEGARPVATMAVARTRVLGLPFEAGPRELAPLGPDDVREDLVGSTTGIPLVVVGEDNFFGRRRIDERLAHGEDAVEDAGRPVDDDVPAALGEAGHQHQAGLLGDGPRRIVEQGKVG